MLNFLDRIPMPVVAAMLCVSSSGLTLIAAEIVDPQQLAFGFLIAVVLLVGVICGVGLRSAGEA